MISEVFLTMESGCFKEENINCMLCTLIIYKNSPNPCFTYYRPEKTRKMCVFARVPMQIGLRADKYPRLLQVHLSRY